jgi:hypothetical protein
MENSVSTYAKRFSGSVHEVAMGRIFAIAIILGDGTNARLTASPYIDR